VCVLFGEMCQIKSAALVCVNESFQQNGKSTHFTFVEKKRRKTLFKILFSLLNMVMLTKVGNKNQNLPMARPRRLRTELITRSNRKGGISITNYKIRNKRKCTKTRFFILLPLFSCLPDSLTFGKGI
jgi:hypothetical protein